ncbi:MAG TPA: ABC transporter substrate-binding protein [Acidimicrobiales bacterium]|nr:ABC transporter substrate-binding protein [Acidimicrobiales bacterium]
MADRRPDFSRREFIEWAGKVGFASMSVLALTSCGGGSSKERASGTNTGGGFKLSGDTMKVGVIAPFSGVGAYVGRIVNNSLDAAVAQINATGGIGGRKVEVVKRDTGTDPAAGVKAYQAFAGDKGVIGILWCGGLGLDESRAQIQRDNMPIVSVFNDLWSGHQLYPEGKERSIFQMIMPDRMAFDLLATYCKDDRGYSKVGLIYDSLLFSTAKGYFQESMAKHGISTAGIETYQLNDADFGPQVNRLRTQKGEALMVWGVSGDTAGIVKQIDKVGGAYVDTPTAKGSAWHPHLMGSPGGTGEHTWADLAGSAAKAGTLTAWHVGGLVYLPSFAIRGWMQKYLKKGVTGGEESPADGLYTLAKAVQTAGTTDRAKIVNAIETMGDIKFASVPFSYSADRHLSKTPDDLILITLERASGPATTDPPYQLGAEWKSTFAAGYVGPTHLVRPTLEANKRAHPAEMDEVLKLGYGTQCTKMPDGSLAKTCKIH